LATITGQLGGMRDTLERLSSVIEQTQAHLKQIMRSDAEATRALAAENRARLDSVRASIAGSVTAEDTELMQIEAATAQRYEDLAQAVAGGIDSAFAHHPVSRLRDSVRAHLQRSQQLLAELEGTVGATRQILADELQRLRGSEPEPVRTGRAAVATAEGQRSGAESALVAAVDAELRTRAGRLVALLRHDIEAAEFGAASAAFFKAAEAGTTDTRAGTTTTPGGTGGARDEAAAPAAETPPSSAVPSTSPTATATPGTATSAGSRRAPSGGGSPQTPR
jgi:hypothetical protein